MRTLYCVIPVYNEAQALPGLIKNLRALVLPKGVNLHILAVDDGSSDGSREILSELQALDMTIIAHVKNQGIPQVYTDALMSLKDSVQAEDVMIIMEGDNTSDLACVPLFFSELQKGADVVIASREMSGGAYIQFPQYRIWGSRTVNRILRMLWRIKGVTDYTIFYRAYRGSLIQKLTETGFAFRARKSFAANGELLLLLSVYRPKVAEVPLQYNYGLKKGPSKMKLFSALYEYMRLTYLYR